MARKRGDGKRGVFWDSQKGGYVVQYNDVAGKKRREFVGPSESRAATVAKKRRQAVKEMRLAGGRLPSRSPLLVEVMAGVLKESRATKRSWRDDERYAQYWGEAFPEMRLDQITPALIQAWRQRRLAGDKVAEEAEGRVAPATINRAVAFLRRVFNVAIQNEQCETNPAARVKMLQENNARVRFLSTADEKKLRGKMLADRWHYVQMAIETGMRKEEQMTMRWEFVNFQTSTITIPRSKHGEMRHVPMSDWVRKTLLDLRKSAGVSSWVYPSEDPEVHVRVHSHVRKAFEGAVRRAELGDFHWHDLRHTFASRLVMSGVDLRTVADLLGHKTLSMVARYSHLMPEHRQNAVQKAADKFRPTD